MRQPGLAWLRRLQGAAVARPDTSGPSVPRAAYDRWRMNSRWP